MRRVPPYFDDMLAARQPHDQARDVHLGFWDAAPHGNDFAAAQFALTRRIATLAIPASSSAILDIGCGFGGLLGLLNQTLQTCLLTGVNIDPRQLNVCREIAPRNGNDITLTAADACALPFADASFDQVYCVEAMFHFASRASFLAEAARVLRPHGRLVLTDFAIAPQTGAAPWPDATMATALQGEYGPWPEIWMPPETLIRHTQRAGFNLDVGQDWTAATLPSYRFTAPHTGRPPSVHPHAGEVLRWLHGSGRLRYLALSLRLNIGVKG